MAQILQMLGIVISAIERYVGLKNKVKNILGM